MTNINPIIVSNYHSTISDRYFHSVVPKIWKSERESYQECDDWYLKRIILNNKKVVLELVIDPYIHIDNSATTYTIIELNVLDVEDPRLIDTPQYSSLWRKVYTIIPLG